mmetsp:Transcript_49705/g.124955  ORF Transcript_49705/g.124955 Transcript_49705/m.124955 type:complete len:275 (-) Transcript_49705:523-1347(-)
MSRGTYSSGATPQLCSAHRRCMSTCSSSSKRCVARKCCRPAIFCAASLSVGLSHIHVGTEARPNGSSPVGVLPSSNIALVSPASACLRAASRSASNRRCSSRSLSVWGCVCRTGTTPVALAWLYARCSSSSSSSSASSSGVVRRSSSSACRASTSSADTPDSPAKRLAMSPHTGATNSCPGRPTTRGCPVGMSCASTSSSRGVPRPRSGESAGVLPKMCGLPASGAMRATTGPTSGSAGEVELNMAAAHRSSSGTSSAASSAARALSTRAHRPA